MILIFLITLRVSVKYWSKRVLHQAVSLWGNGLKNLSLMIITWIIVKKVDHFLAVSRGMVLRDFFLCWIFEKSILSHLKFLLRMEKLMHDCNRGFYSDENFMELMMSMVELFHRFFKKSKIFDHFPEKLLNSESNFERLEDALKNDSVVAWGSYSLGCIKHMTTNTSMILMNDNTIDIMWHRWMEGTIARELVP